jgi:hypothetical protein
MTRSAMRGWGLMAAVLILVAGPTGTARAALVYTTASGLTQTQTNLVITTLANGNLLYATTNVITNNNGFAVEGIYQVVTSRTINGAAATWDDANQLWRAGTLFTRAVNASLSIPMDRAVTDLPIVAGSGVTTASSLSAFFVGRLAAGASATIVRQYEASPGVTSIGSTLGLVSGVPEPSSLALCSLGSLAGLGAWARRRKAATG